MNISQTIDNFVKTLTLAAGEHHPVKQMGRYFILKSNTSATDLQVAFGKSQHFTTWPVLWSFQTRNPEDFFEQVVLYNSSGAAMTVEFMISTDWIDNRSSEVTGSVTIPIDDTSDSVYSHAGIRVLPDYVLIDAAAAVNVGGGVVGIPVTGQTFATGESIDIAGTVNYNGTFTVLGSSGANQVNITATYVAEVFAGTETIGLTTPRSILPDATCKELIAWNDHATLNLRWGDSTVYARGVDPSLPRGIPILANTAFIIPCTGRIYFVADINAGVGGMWLQANELRKS